MRSVQRLTRIAQGEDSMSGLYNVITDGIMAVSSFIFNNYLLVEWDDNSLIYLPMYYRLNRVICIKLFNKVFASASHWEGWRWHHLPMYLSEYWGISSSKTTEILFVSKWFAEWRTKCMRPHFLFFQICVRDKSAAARLSAHCPHEISFSHLIGTLS